MESLTPLIAPIGRWGAAYSALNEALGLPRISQKTLVRATTVPQNHMSKILVPALTTLTQKVPWDRVLDPSTVWVSKGTQAMSFTSDVMEQLVKSGKVKRVLPAWKASVAQKAADQSMRDVDAFGDFLNREVAGGGGGALGMGAPTPAASSPAAPAKAKVAADAKAATPPGPSKFEKTLEHLSSKLVPEIESYEAKFSWPKDKDALRKQPGSADVAVPLSPKSLAKFEAANAAAAPKKRQVSLEIDGDALNALKKMLADPKRNPFLSADPPKYVASKAEAARAVQQAKQAIVGDVRKAMAAAQAGKGEAASSLFGALKGAGKEVGKAGVVRASSA
jgi:hypothetical protein